MTISYYGGLPGSGKSYSLVKRVIAPALSMNRKVITNIPLNVLHLKKQHPDCDFLQLERGKESMIEIALLFLIPQFDNESLTPGEAKKRYLSLKSKPERDAISFEIDQANAGAVLILDELLFYLPSGLAANKIDKSIKDLFAMHRHITDGDYSMEIYLCSQDSSQIAPFARSLVEQSFIVRKNSIGKKSFMTVSKYSGCYGQSGGAAKEQLLGKAEDRFKPEFFAYYQSQTYNKGDKKQADEFKLVDETNLLKQGSFKTLVLSVIAIPILFYFAYSSFNNIFFKNKADKTDDKSSLASDVSTQGAANTDLSQLKGGTVKIQNGKIIVDEAKRSIIDNYADWDFYYSELQFYDYKQLFIYMFKADKKITLDLDFIKSYKLDYKIVGSVMVLKVAGQDRIVSKLSDRLESQDKGGLLSVLSDDQ